LRVAELSTRINQNGGVPYLGATFSRRAAAYAVHMYTASGAVLAFLIVAAAIQGAVRLALGLEFVTMVIDGTDGWLARRVEVSHVVALDGGKLDDIVDYLTYVFAPIVLLWKAGYLPGGPAGLVAAALPLLASCYQFCQANAKTADHFFLGFPSYWNIVAFYAIVFHLTPLVVSLILVVCSMLVFVPIKYVYPSRTLPFRALTLALTGAWLLLYLIIVLRLPQPSPWLAYGSLLFAVYYVALSLYLTSTSGPPAERRVRDETDGR
jgi:phosphatidylcholine synthase